MRARTREFMSGTFGRRYGTSRTVAPHYHRSVVRVPGPVIGSSGYTVMLEGTDSKFQQAVLCISAKLGGFVYDRNLGSKVLLQDKTLSAKQTELLANESLAKMKNTYASVKSVGKTITINLTVDDITREVQINGNL